MKLILTLFLCSINSFAYEGFHCIPSMRQTRIQVLDKGTTIELLVVNPSGYDFMPQFDSAGSKFSLSFNKMQAEDLKELSDGFIFSWPKTQCKLDSGNFTVNCGGEALAPVASVKTYGISTTEITEKYQDNVYEKRRFRLSAEKDNIYFVNLEFYKPNCEKF